MSTIFVSVASFCDVNLLFTLRDAVAKADQPELLCFGVIDQHPVLRRQEVREAVDNAQVRYTHVHPVESRGVCWARSLAFGLYSNETYLLQIDSHMWFEKGWDSQLKAQLDNLRHQTSKPILTAYPYGFEFDDNDEPTVSVRVGDKTTLVMRPHPETTLTEESATLRFTSEHVFRREPVKGCHVAGGFLFTLGQFVQEVPYDPQLYFHGEEQSLAVRAYTHGWDIFHPPVIPLYHLYKPKNTAHPTQHWSKEWEVLRDFKYADLTELAKQRLMDLLYERKHLGIYGLGEVRDLADYARLSGIDYRGKRLVQPFKDEYVFESIDADATPKQRNGGVGVFMPTHGRPDFARAALLQMAAQTVKPDVVVVFQNGDAASYEALVRDVSWPFELVWLHEPAKIKQHEWYSVPLKVLLEMGCDRFFWLDHDDMYHANHVAQSLKDLEDSDWRIGLYANVLYVDKTNYQLRERVRFTSHAPGGMSASMAFNERFARALVVDLDADSTHYYSDNVVAHVTLPKFKACYSDVLTTTYLAHRGSHSASTWVTSVFGEEV